MKKCILLVLCVSFILPLIACEFGNKNRGNEWIKSVKGKSFSNEEGSMIFDNDGNLIIKANLSEDSGAFTLVASLILESIPMKFFSSPKKNKAIYKIKIADIDSYAGFSIHNKELRMYGDFANTPDEIDWENSSAVFKRK